MPLLIKNNIAAENAARELGKTYGLLARSIQRLSSGLRINSAKDDAAGLAVRELMRADIAVIRQGSRNASDGVSMLQTMEGAMGAIDELLIRMKELAEQASTGSYSSQQRAIMDNEYGQMLQEIDRIATRTEFNNTNLLNSATNSVQIHFGINTAGSASSITVNSVDVRAAALGINENSANHRITTSANAQTALVAVNEAIKAKDSARATFGYMMNRMEYSQSVLDIQAENLAAAESRISDVDVAKEMSAFTRNQVLAQAGVAMLAQANTIPQMALTLLR